MTIDRSWLAAWLQPQHLEPQALRSYHESFAAGSPHVVVLRDLLLRPIADRLSRLLTQEARYSASYGSRRRFGLVPEAEFHELPEAERFFSFGLLARESVAASRSLDADTFRAFTRALADPRMSAFFAAVSGLSLGASELSVRSMRRGDFLAPHDDDIGTRLLSFFIYLTPDWEPRFGGELVMPRSDGRGQPSGPSVDGHEEVIVPEYNSVSIFDVRASHHIAPLADALGERTRVTFGGWFLRGAETRPA